MDPHTTNDEWRPKMLHDAEVLRNRVYEKIIESIYNPPYAENDPRMTSYCAQLCRHYDQLNTLIAKIRANATAK